MLGMRCSEITVRLLLTSYFLLLQTDVLINSEPFYQLGFGNELSDTKTYRDIEVTEEDAVRLIEILHNLRNKWHGPCLHRHLECNSKNKRKYQTFDGTCNNLGHPTWGMAFSCVEHLHAIYDDGISTFRKSVSGNELPRPRDITLKIHNDVPKSSRHITNMILWSQLLAHDVSHTPLKNASGAGINCCPASANSDPQCVPFLLGKDDPFYSQYGVDCLNGIRIGICNNGSQGPRKHISQATSFIDLSNVYGTDLKTARPLRQLDGTGRFLSNRSIGNEDIPIGRDGDVPLGFDDQCKPQFNLSCFLAGDSRIAQQPPLTSFHVLFLREHNYMALKLKELNPIWDDDKIFMETRRILIAELQAITYNEFLPLTIGKDLMQLFGLQVRQKGYTHYNPFLYPALLTEFTGAAFRFGHAMVNGIFREIYKNGDAYFQLRNNYFYPFRMYADQADGLLRGMTMQPASAFNRHITEDMTNYGLHVSYSNRSYGTDLTSIDIMRGRDGGIPPYTYMVEYCSGLKIRSFDDLDKYMFPGASYLYRSVYESVEDIDFFTGLVSEAHDDKTIVGPTTGCILAMQFYLLKYGDRFYFEHGNQAGSFTPDQLEELRRTSLASIICRNTNIERLQPQVFILSGNGNSIQPCENIYSINLSAWKERYF